MSRIYDALKLLQRDLAATPRRPVTRHAEEPDRRRSARRRQQVPVFVYGHSAQGTPFYEETHMTCVNAGGGLTTLAAQVAPGQELLLVNLGTQHERACRVVHIDARAGHRASIALAFPEAQAGFWDPQE